MQNPMEYMTTNHEKHTCLLSGVHWFSAQCIFSVPKPTLPVEGFVDVCTVNCSPCLQEKKILFSQGICKMLVFEYHGYMMNKNTHIKNKTQS